MSILAAAPSKSSQYIKVVEGSNLVAWAVDVR